MRVIADFHLHSKYSRATSRDMILEKIAEGISRVRQGNIQIEPGYDGVFGKVRVFSDKSAEPQQQISLF